MGNIIREVTAEAAWVPLSFLAMFRNVSPHNFFTVFPLYTTCVPYCIAFLINMSFFLLTYQN